jgi:predicted O-methyltransferase YrrM
MSQPEIEGQFFLTASCWLGIVEQENRPINYLEIGVHAGVNALSVNTLYAAHPQSKLYCIDPWEDYDEYREYKGIQETVYSQFTRNIKAFNIEDKVVIKRGFSNIIVPTLEDNFFDIIYIDGNHEPEYALEDAVLSFRKLKVGGYLIFDDYNFDGPDGTSRGIDGFLSGYHKRIQVIGKKWSSMNLAQVFVKKIR